MSRPDPSAGPPGVDPIPPHRFGSKVELARRLSEERPEPSRDHAIEELLLREGQEIGVRARRAIRERREFSVTSERFFARVAGIAARRFLEQAERCEARAMEETLILDFRPPHLADLYLAMACAERPRDNVAWNCLVLEHGSELRRVARQFRTVGSDEDAVQTFLAALWTIRSTGTCFLATYRGLAPLRAWLLLVLRRRLARTATSPVVAPLPESLADGTRADPTDAVAREDLWRALIPAVAELLAALPERDRNFLESQLLLNEEGVKIAARHGVSPSYVSRRCRELKEALRQKLSQWLRRHGVAPEDLR